MVYNKILVEFEFIINLDIAMFNYIKDLNESVIDNRILEFEEYKVNQIMLGREHINPMELFMPEYDTTDMYTDIMENNMEDLLKHAKAYDSFGLMITFLNNANYISITVLCENQIQADFIKKLNSRLNTIVSNRSSVNLDDYDTLYIKYYINSLLYDIHKLKGKHIYIANARYNMDDQNINIPSLHISVLISDVNIIHSMDLFTNIKYIGERKEAKNDE